MVATLDLVEPRQEMIEIRVKAVFNLIIRRATTTVVRVVACKLELPTIYGNHSLVVSTPFHAGKKWGSHLKTGEINHRRRMSSWYRHHNVGSVG